MRKIVDEIVLPSAEPGVPGRKFTFDYNSANTESATTNNIRIGSCVASLQSYTRQASQGWGSLSRVVTPAGAEILYSYSMDSPSFQAHSVFTPDEIPGETITKKTVVQDGPDDVWTYTIGETGGSQTYLADNSTVSEIKYVQGAAHGTGFGGSLYGISGPVYRSIRPFTTIERHWTNLIFTGASLNSPGGTVAFNSVVDAEYTTLTDANGNALKMSAKTFTYDYNGNVTQTNEYDWFDPALVSREANGVPAGVPATATLLRTTNNTYYNAATEASSGNVYAKRSAGAPLILNALKETTLGPSIVRFSYDGQPYDTPPTAGNLTTRSIWDNLDNKWISTPNSIGRIDAFVIQRANQTGPDYGGQIFLNAKGGLWRGAQSGGDDGTAADWILYGASVLRHEQWHRDARTHADRSSERLAYRVQRPVLQAFQNDFSNASFYQKKLKMVTDRGR